MNRQRANWDHDSMKLLLELCLHEKEASNFNSKGPNNEGWYNIHSGMKAKYGDKFSPEQTCRKLASLKKAYTGWKHLQLSQTGLGRDPNTGAISADGSFWAGVRKSLRGACQPPPFLDELSKLYDRTPQDRGTLVCAGGMSQRSVDSAGGVPQMMGNVGSAFPVDAVGAIGVPQRSVSVGSTWPVDVDGAGGVPQMSVNVGSAWPVDVDGAGGVPQRSVNVASAWPVDVDGAGAVPQRSVNVGSPWSVNFSSPYGAPQRSVNFGSPCGAPQRSLNVGSPYVVPPRSVNVCSAGGVGQMSLNVGSDDTLQWPAASARRNSEQMDVNSPPRKRTSSSLEDCAHILAANAVHQMQRRNKSDSERRRKPDSEHQWKPGPEEVELKQVFKVLKDDGIEGGSELHCKAFILCKENLNHLAFLELSKPEARMNWIMFNWEHQQHKDTCNQHSIQSCKDRLIISERDAAARAISTVNKGAGTASNLFSIDANICRMSASIEEYSYNSDTSSAYSSDTSSDASSIIYHVAAFGVAATALAISRNNEQPAVAHHPPLPFPHVTGRQWVQLNLHNPTRCWKNFRMSPISFLHLHELLVRHHGLQSTQEVESIEALAMFVLSCAHAQPAGQIEDKFERSASTVSRKMSEVGQVIFHFANYVIGPRDPDYRTISPEVAKYSPFFDGCIGVVDGTHIPIKASTRQLRQNLINRVGATTFNVLAIVNFDSRFTFVATGTSGGCYDMEVLRRCWANRSFPHPPRGLYYLVDSAYELRGGYLPPYPMTERAPQTREAKFNKYHSLLRLKVERSFGTVKGK
ncbi:hypothetical protein EJB05_31678, partial [Eragrostis curvula]